MKKKTKQSKLEAFFPKCDVTVTLEPVRPGSRLFKVNLYVGKRYVNTLVENLPWKRAEKIYREERKKVERECI